MKIRGHLNTVLIVMVVYLNFCVGMPTSENASDSSPRDTSLNNTPKIPTDPKYIKFYSFPDNKDPQKAHEIELGSSDTLKESGLIQGLKVTIITHGFYGSYSSNRSSCQPIKNAYLENGFKNIICVDWSKLAIPTAPLPYGLLQYIEVVNNVVTVGRSLALFIEFLIKNKIIFGPDMVHLIGHSLGSHISGAAGKVVKERLRDKVRRITALDPAGPYYYPFRPKLNRHDADFVDCLHTDIEFYGVSESLGDADFYTNGGVGQKQPGCENETVFDVVDPTKGRCSHRNAWIYYARTIAGEKLVGCRCRKDSRLEYNAECIPPSDGRCRSPATYGEFGPEWIRGDFNIQLLS